VLVAEPQHHSDISIGIQQSLFGFHSVHSLEWRIVTACDLSDARPEVISVLRLTVGVILVHEVHTCMYAVNILHRAEGETEAGLHMFCCTKAQVLVVIAQCHRLEY
jgi:hypothetical protein